MTSKYTMIDTTIFQISEEKKVQIAMRNQEESIAKIKEVERLLKEATKFKFNTNVFK